MDQKLQDEIVVFALTAWAETIRMRHALAPFARTSGAHGVRKDKDDLWVSCGVAASAWIRAREICGT